MDALYILIVLLFFAVALAYSNLCDHL